MTQELDIDGFDRDRLVELAGQLCDEQITPDKVAELEEILKSHAEARKLFHLTVALDRDLGLCEIASDHEKTVDSSTQPEVPAPPKVRATSQSDAANQANVVPTRRSFPASRFALAGVALLVVVSSGYLLFRGGEPNGGADNVASFGATITHLTDVTWAEGHSQFGVGDNVSTRRLRIDAGSVRLTYSHGVVTTIEGPADIEFVSRDRAILHYGQQVTYVPEGAEGYRVDTPTAGVVDLGTEFGVTVARTGETELSVFDGKVELTTRESNSDDSSATKEIVTAGQARRVDRQGRSTPFALQPYKEARDALRGWQIIWEPFGPGSGTGPFPGNAGAGWQGEWDVRLRNGVLDKERSGIFAGSKLNDRRFPVGSPLYPGAEYFCTVTAVAEADAGNEALQLQLVRPFGSIDEFTTSQPYTIEFLLRLESKLDSLQTFRAFGKPVAASEAEPVTWQLRAVAENDTATWLMPETDAGVLPLEEQQSFRCFVEVDPIEKRWRATIASRTDSATIDSSGGIPLTNSADGIMVLGFEAIGSDSRPVAFSVDGIRIQNHPSTGAIAEKQ